MSTKPAGVRLGVAFQLKFFCTNGYFAGQGTEPSEEAIVYLADQLGIGRSRLPDYDFTSRSARRHCAEILRYLGFRRMKKADRAALVDWMARELCQGGGTVAAMLDTVFLWCRDRRIFAPRLKAISRQKLALPFTGLRAELTNLSPVLSGVIDWEEVEQQYDEMVKYTSAMHSGLADPEAILRRFARGEVMHPTYKALSKLGRRSRPSTCVRRLSDGRFTKA